MKVTRNELTHLIQTGAIPADKVDLALQHTQISPDNTAWKHFLERLLLWLGSLAIVSSLIFFIAYNWDALGRFAKFGLVELLIVASILAYWKTHKTKILLSQVFLMLASLFLGVLLAFYGQTYQTGADTWQLFFTWCLLILPWTILSRFAAQWIIWLVLLNISAIIYLDTYGGLFGLVFNRDSGVLWLPTIINSSALFIWQLLENKWKWLSQDWAIRLLAVASGTPLTFLVMDSIFSRHHALLPGFLWLAAMAVVYLVYRKIKPDLFMLAIACLSGISVIISLTGKILFDILPGDMGAFLILALFVVMLGGSAAIWLKNIHKELLINERSES